MIVSSLSFLEETRHKTRFPESRDQRHKSVLKKKPVLSNWKAFSLIDRHLVFIWN